MFGTWLKTATLRLFSVAEQCHTPNFYLRCFKSDFDAVKSKFGLLKNADDLKMEFQMKNIIYKALPMCAQTEKTAFSCKDDCTLTKHTQRWTYSAGDFEIPLCPIPPLRSFLNHFYLSMKNKLF